MTDTSFRPLIRSRIRKARLPIAVAAIVVLVAAGCGARLSKAELAALNSSSSGAGSGAGTGAGTGSGTNTGGTSIAATSTAGTRTGGITTGGTKTGGTTTGGSPASGSVAAANNPLAGPGGKLCPSGAAGSGPGVTSSQITVGNIATINGPVPGLFAGARYGTEAVAAYINSLGGVCGRQLVVDSADDQFDQATDQNEAQQMAGQVLGFVGSFSLQDSGIPAGAPGVPDVGDTLTSQRFDSPTNFSPQPNAPGYNIGGYEYIKSLPQYASATQHMAMLVEDTPQTLTTGQWMYSALKSIGYHFVFTDFTLQPTDPTFNGDVEKMKSDGVTGVEFQATSTIIGQLANAMYQAGMTISFGNYSPPAYNPAYIQNAGPGDDGTVIEQSMALYDGQDAASIPMVATLDQWYSRVDPGQVPDIYAVYGWMSGLLFAEGLNEGGAPTRSALLAGLKQITSFTAGGLSPPDNPVAKTPPSCWVLIDVKGGQFVRDPATPTGFRCSPAGYYHYTG